mgnify:CR=1 FL=1|jgi:hypothetical protein
MSAIVSHLGVREHDRLPIASPNQMHPLPQVPNFCGNGFNPWTGTLPEVFVLIATLFCDVQLFYIICYLCIMC